MDLLGGGEDGFARRTPDARLLRRLKGVRPAFEQAGDGVELAGEVHQREGDERGGMARDGDGLVDGAEAGFGVAAEDFGLDAPHLLLARGARELADERGVDRRVPGGARELAEFGVDAPEIGSDARDEQLGGFALERGVEALGGAPDGPLDGLALGEGVTLEDDAVLADGLVEVAGAPRVGAEDECGHLGGRGGVALEKWAGVAGDELLGGVDDDELVLHHQADGAAFIEDVGDGGGVAVEAEGVDVAVFLDEQLAQLLRVEAAE